MQAEMFSSEAKNEEARESYAAAIESAQSSGFIHEQGLSLELAGFHYKRIGDHASAYRLLCQAKQCYDEWGSEMKVESVARQLESVGYNPLKGKGKIHGCTLK